MSGMFANDQIRAAGELAGRVLLASLFVVEAAEKLANLSGAASYMAASGLPVVFLPPAVAVELGCGLAIIAGWWTRPAAFLLAGFCILTALIFHTNFVDRNQVIHFEKDLALAGAFLILWAKGAGRFSLDALRRAPPSQGQMDTTDAPFDANRPE